MIMTTEERLEWIKKNAGRLAQTTTKHTKHKGRIIGYRNMDLAVILEASVYGIWKNEPRHTCFTQLIPGSRFGYCFSIGDIEIIGKSNQELKTAEIKRLDGELLTLTNQLAVAPSPSLAVFYIRESMSKIEERIEELELSGSEPYLSREII